MIYSIRNQPVVEIDAKLFRIESMGLKDLEEVIEIENSSFVTPWKQRLFEEELDNPSSRIFLYKKYYRQHFGRSILTDQRQTQ